MKRAKTFFTILSLASFLSFGFLGCQGEKAADSTPTIKVAGTEAEVASAEVEVAGAEAVATAGEANATPAAVKPTDTPALVGTPPEAPAGKAPRSVSTPSVAKAVAPVAKPVAPVAKSVASVVKPAVPVAKPVASVAKPVASVAKPVAPVAQAKKAVAPVAAQAKPAKPVTAKPATAKAAKVKPAQAKAAPVGPALEPVEKAKVEPVAMANPTNHPPATVSLHLLGAVDPEVVTRVKKWVGTYAWINVVEGAPVSTPQAGLETQVKRFFAESDRKLHLSVILSQSHSEDPAHGYFDPVTRIGAVNLAVLEDKDREKFFRRVERQVMRIVGKSVGLLPCPNPFCCHSPYKTLEQLDSGSRNCCPPCMMKYIQAADRKKVGLVDNETFRLPVGLKATGPLPGGTATPGPAIKRGLPPGVQGPAAPAKP